jgi:hypothetical protein
MSLAFDVIESVIVGGRKAEYFRQVKRDFEAHSEAQSSLLLATQAKRVQPAAAVTSLDHAAATLQDLLARMKSAAPDEKAAHAAAQALEAFRAFGSDRWLSATAQLLVALGALGALPGSEPTSEEPAPRAQRIASKRRAAPRKKHPKAKTAVPAAKPKKKRKKTGKARKRNSAKRRV